MLVVEMFEEMASVGFEMLALFFCDHHDVNFDFGVSVCFRCEGTKILKLFSSLFRRKGKSKKNW
jgi:hypothetical protein